MLAVVKVEESVGGGEEERRGRQRPSVVPGREQGLVEVARVPVEAVAVGDWEQEEGAGEAVVKGWAGSASAWATYLTFQQHAPGPAQSICCFSEASLFL